MRISIEDSRDLAFVLWALSCEAISNEEFRRWAATVVSEIENPPAYFFDLIDFQGHLKDIPGVLGFTPEWEPSTEELLAMYGLAYLRGVKPFEAQEQGRCLHALRTHPDIHAHFTSMFPHIVVPRVTA